MLRIKQSKALKRLGKVAIFLLYAHKIKLISPWRLKSAYCWRRNPWLFHQFYVSFPRVPEIFLVRQFRCLNLYHCPTRSTSRFTSKRRHKSAPGYTCLNFCALKSSFFFSRHMICILFFMFTTHLTTEIMWYRFLLDSTFWRSYSHLILCIAFSSNRFFVLQVTLN